LTSAERDAGRGNDGANDRALSIGAVLAGLRAEFPDVTVSKIRFLESEGLVTPRRTASGYRQFSAADVGRLRFVLAAQRDQYLPLKVIKEQLDAMDRGLRSPTVTALKPRSAAGPAGSGGPGGPAADGMPTAADFAAGSEIRMTLEELLAAAGIDAAMLADLEQHGLIRPGAAGFYDADSVLVARTALALTEFGLQARHLRSFRTAADREVGLIAQIVTPVARQRDPDARERADDVVRELAALTVRLHALLVKAGLREVSSR
jgi:DNA-binding transcriptional MerR regulator